MVSHPDPRMCRECEALRLVRFADDFVVLVSGTRAHAEALRREVAQVLAPIGLRLSEAKTRVCHIDEGFDFLSFRLQRKRKRGSHKRYVYTFISPKAIKTIRWKVKALTRRSSFCRKPEELIEIINQMLRGWANYFRHAVAKRVFAGLGWYARIRVSRWMRERMKGRRRMTWKAFRRRYNVPQQGLVVNGTQLFNPGTVPVNRYRYRRRQRPGHEDHQPARAAHQRAVDGRQPAQQDHRGQRRVPQLRVQHQRVPQQPHRPERQRH